MEKHLKILLIEDNDNDAALLQHHLEREGFVVIPDRIDNGQDMQKRLKNHLYDLIICDFRLPKFSGEHALEIFKSSGLDIPFILVSGTIGEEVAVGMMKAGAYDYIMKDQLRKIVPAVTRELCEASLRQHRRQTIEELKLAKERAEPMW
jgi:DNA-binding NtrC family response regulator